eukprot:6312278-Alexandrium_andersonii.AAC.1
MLAARRCSVLAGPSLRVIGPSRWGDLWPLPAGTGGLRDVRCRSELGAVSRSPLPRVGSLRPAAWLIGSACGWCCLRVVFVGPGRIVQYAASPSRGSASSHALIPRFGSLRPAVGLPICGLQLRAIISSAFTQAWPHGLGCPDPLPLVFAALAMSWVAVYPPALSKDRPLIA